MGQRIIITKRRAVDTLNKRGMVDRDLKAQELRQQGPFRKERPPVQCHQCMGWGHYARNCPNEFPVEGSVNWGNQNGEVAKQGGTLPQTGQCHPNSNPNPGAATGSTRAITSTVNKRANEGVLKGEGFIPAPEYHNPDPLVRLIGPANEGKVKVEGVETTALIDTGACMSAITKKFRRSVRIRIKTLKFCVGHRGKLGEEKSLIMVMSNVDLIYLK